ncbi:MAG TPA: DUF6263 family protein [Planctomycetota bacterium]|nr:DUF6263 family protein [Planctomycetota bacterium]
MAGHTARCPVCGTHMAVPQAPAAPLADELQLRESTPPAGGPWDAAVGVPEYAPPSPRARPARSARRLAPLAAGAVAALVVVGAAVYFLALRGGRRHKGPFGKPPVIQSSYKGPKVQMKILLNPGRYTIVETQEDRGTQTVKAGRESQDANTSSTVRVDGEIEIQPPHATTGERRVTYTCTRVKMDADQGGQKMSFHSDDPKASPRDPGSQMLAGVLGAMVGWTGVQVYSKDGKFLRLEGLEHLLTKMRAAPGGPQMAAVMRKMLEPLLRDTLTRHWGKLLPADPVGPGDTWQRRVDFEQFPMFGDLDFDFTCWLTDVEESPAGKVAVMLCDGSARLRDRDLDMSGMGIPGAPKTTVDDMTLLLRMTVKFPLHIGLATEVNGNVALDGSMTIRVLGQTARSTLEQDSRFGYTLTPK